MIEDYYGALGVPRTASKGEIELAYEARTREWERARDAGDPRAPHRLALVKAARDFLIDDSKRELYDEIDKPVELPPPPVLVPGEEPPPEPEPFAVEKPPEQPPDETARKSRIFWGRVFGVFAIVLGVIFILAGRSSDPSRDPYRGAMGLDLLLDFFVPRSNGYASYERSGVRTIIEGLCLFLLGVAFLLFPEACNPF